MLKAILAAIFGSFGGNAAAGVAKAVEVTAILAAATPAFIWFANGGKDEIFVSFDLTYGQAVCLGLLFLWVARVIRRAAPPAPMSLRDVDPYA